MDNPKDAAVDPAASRKADKRAAKAAKAEAALAERTRKAEAKAVDKAAKQERKTAKTGSKLRRSEAKAAAKASKAAAKQAKEDAAKAATRPARAVDRLTDPKTAKRAISVGKVLAPAVAPYAIKAAVGARGFLDQQRALRLGVPVGEVAQFRGPTGATGARINGLSRSIVELGSRKNNELQVIRFAEVSRERLADLTTAVQASASMPRARRTRVLRAINRELDQISSDLMTHLVGSSAA